MRFLGTLINAGVGRIFRDSIGRGIESVDLK